MILIFAAILVLQSWSPVLCRSVSRDDVTLSSPGRVGHLLLPFQGPDGRKEEREIKVRFIPFKEDGDVDNKHIAIHVPKQKNIDQLPVAIVVGSHGYDKKQLKNVINNKNDINKRLNYKVTIVKSLESLNDEISNEGNEELVKQIKKRLQQSQNDEPISYSSNSDEEAKLNIGDKVKETNANQGIRDESQNDENTDAQRLVEHILGKIKKHRQEVSESNSSSEEDDKDGELNQIHGLEKWNIIEESEEPDSNDKLDVRNLIKYLQGNIRKHRRERKKPDKRIIDESESEDDISSNEEDEEVKFNLRNTNQNVREDSEIDENFDVQRLVKHIKGKDQKHKRKQDIKVSKESQSDRGSSSSSEDDKEVMVRANQESEESESEESLNTQRLLKHSRRTGQNIRDRTEQNKRVSNEGSSGIQEKKNMSEKKYEHKSETDKIASSQAENDHKPTSQEERGKKTASLGESDQNTASHEKRGEKTASYGESDEKAGSHEERDKTIASHGESNANVKEVQKIKEQQNDDLLEENSNNQNISKEAEIDREKILMNMIKEHSVKEIEKQAGAEQSGETRGTNDSSENDESQEIKLNLERHQERGISIKQDTKVSDESQSSDSYYEYSDTSALSPIDLSSDSSAETKPTLDEKNNVETVKKSQKDSSSNEDLNTSEKSVDDEDDSSVIDDTSESENDASITEEDTQISSHKTSNQDKNSNISAQKFKQYSLESYSGINSSDDNAESSQVERLHFIPVVITEDSVSVESKFERKKEEREFFEEDLSEESTESVSVEISKNKERNHTRLSNKVSAEEKVKRKSHNSSCELKKTGMHLEDLSAELEHVEVHIIDAVTSAIKTHEHASSHEGKTYNLSFVFNKR